MSTMGNSGEVPNSFTLYITNIDAEGPFIRICGQSNKHTTLALDQLMESIEHDLRAGKGTLAPGVVLTPGSICLAQYKDGVFYRSRVLEVREGMVSVLFIDYGNRDFVLPSAIRSLDYFPPQLAKLTGQASEFILARAAHTLGRWDENSLGHIQRYLLNRDFQCTIEAKLPRWTTISITVGGNDLVDSFASMKLCVITNPQQQADYLNHLADTIIQTPRVRTVPTPSNYCEHVVPFANRGFPSNPASAMRIQNISSTLNGSYVAADPGLPMAASGLPMATSAVSQRLIAHRTAPRNVVNLRPLSRQPFSSGPTAEHAEQPQAVAVAAPAPTVAPAVSSPGSSPRKTTGYKTRILEVNSEYRVYVSFARDGPELFAVQLTSETRNVQEMMKEINRMPHRSLTEPPMIGTVCLGRMSCERLICRAVVMNLTGTQCKLYFVDFGDTELVSYYDIFDIPEQFVKPSVYAMRFRLSGLADLKRESSLKDTFQQLVEHQAVTLRVVPPEGPPLIQYGELYINGVSVKDKLMEATAAEVILKRQPTLPVGTKSLVLVSFVDSCVKFFIQLSDNVDLLNEVMAAVEVHCKSSAPLTSVQVGAPCCALFPEDELWYRAEVVSVTGDRALVCYVDYGNEQEVSVSELRSITPKLLELPAQALKCALKGFEDKPVEPKTSNQLEMLALERTLKAQVHDLLAEDTMLVSLVHEGVSPPLDIARRMNQLSQPPNPHKSKPPPAVSPEAPAAAPAPSVPSLEDEQPGNRFRSDKYFREDRKRDDEGPARGGSFRGKEREKKGLERSGPGRHSERQTRDRNGRQGGKPWERNNERSDWDEPGSSGRPGGRRKTKSEQEEPGKGNWKGKGERRRRPEQGQGQEREADSAPRTNSSVQQRLRRDNYQERKRYGDEHDHRDKEDNWGEKKDSWGDKKESRKDDWGDKREGRKNDWGDKRESRKDDWGDKTESRKNDWGDKRESRKDDWGDKRENRKNDWGDKAEGRNNDWGDKAEGRKNDWGDKADGRKNDWGDRKEYPKRNFQDRGDRKESFTPRDSNRSFGSNKSADKELPAPVPLDTQFTSPEIEMGSQLEISVAWFISPESFFAQITSHQASFTEMMNKIPEIYKGVKTYTGAIGVGSSILARYPEDRVLYRASVLGVQSFGKYVVQYIDFGNKYIVDAKDIWQLDQQLMTIPKMAVHCSLSGVKPPGEEWLQSKDVDLAFNAPRYQCVFQECVDDTYKVSLWNNGVSVAEILAEKNLAVLCESSAVTLKDEPIDLPIVINQEIMCRVTHVDSFQRFSVQLDLEKADLVESTIAAVDKATLQPLPAESVVDGTHCTVTHDGRLYRAILLDATDKDNVKAQLPDYGNTITVPSSNLWGLPTELSVYYYQSLTCRLNNYEEGSAKLMSDEELAAKILGNKVIMYINDIDGIELMGTLYDLSGAKISAFEPDEGAYETVTPLCQRAVYNYNFGNAYLVHADSLAQLYLQKASDADRVAELLEKLFKFYEEGTPEDLESFDPEGLCAAKSSDGNWYRGTIVTIGDETCNIQFLDYGNSEEIAKTSIKKLDASFYEPYCLALVVSLGLTPLQEDAVTKLSDMLADKEVLVTLTVGDEGWLANLNMNGEDLSLKLVNDKIAAPITSEETNVATAAPEEPISLPPGTVQVYISHVDTPGQFWLQMADKVDKIEEIQAELQKNSVSYPELENKEINTLCIAKYSVDEMWYRAEILDSDSDITTVRFIDYGNTDVLDNVTGVMKAIPHHLQDIERFVVKSSVNAVPTGTGQWSEPSSDYFIELVGDMSEPVEALIVLKDVTTYVDLFVKGQNLTDKLVAEGHATRSDEPECGDLPSCFASHVNSPSEFWIQLENTAPELQAVDEAMADAENFQELTCKEEGTLCAAKYPEDGCWYRAQIIVEGSEGTEVLFMDYGNASIATELRTLPDELKAKPALSRKCALQKPRDIKCWSRKSEVKFNEMAAEGATIFNIQFIASGDISIVELYQDGKSLTEELAALCEGPPVTERPAPLGQDLLTNGTVCHSNSPMDFYVQLDKTSDKITERMSEAESFEIATDIKVGSLVAAFWDEDEQWYRAKIIEFCDVGSHVLFLDYGNKAKCEKFRQLPAELAELEPLAIHCALAAYELDQKQIEAFKNLVEDDPETVFQIEFLDTTKEPRLVKLLLNEKDVSDLIKEPSLCVDENVTKANEGDLEEALCPTAGNETIIVESIDNVENKAPVKSTAGSDEKITPIEACIADKAAVDDEVDLEVSTLDDSVNVTVIENKSIDESENMEISAIETEVKTGQLDESGPLESEEFTTPPNRSHENTQENVATGENSPKKKDRLNVSLASTESKSDAEDKVDNESETPKIREPENVSTDIGVPESTKETQDKPPVDHVYSENVVSVESITSEPQKSKAELRPEDIELEKPKDVEPKESSFGSTSLSIGTVNEPKDTEPVETKYTELAETEPVKTKDTEPIEIKDIDLVETNDMKAVDSNQTELVEFKDAETVELTDTESAVNQHTTLPESVNEPKDTEPVETKYTELAETEPVKTKDTEPIEIKDIDLVETNDMKAVDSNQTELVEFKDAETVELTDTKSAVNQHATIAESKEKDKTKVEIAATECEDKTSDETSKETEKVKKT